MAGADGATPQDVPKYSSISRSQEQRGEGLEPGGVVKFVAHSSRVLRMAGAFGWRPGARYTNLRDVRQVAFERVGFLDIHWKRYSFEAHLRAAEMTRPCVTVARDVENVRQLDKILKEAEALERHASRVVVVPKDVRMSGRFDQLIPERFILGFSVPTRYGGTSLSADDFNRPVHLLGGRPDRQRALANSMPVVSVDCNRFTLDAGFGDFFDGEKFRPHPIGGYERCLAASIENIDLLWRDYPSAGLPSLKGEDDGR
jgi:hypothetical protein